MRTNLEKWNHYLKIVDEKTQQFYSTLVGDRELPEKYYIVYPIGKIAERTIIGPDYSHYKHGARTFFTGKSPTKAEVEALKDYAESNIPFSAEHAWLTYTELYGSGLKSSSSVKLSDVLEQKGLYYNIEDAAPEKERMEEKINYKNFHKKDASYNYKENGYKFLGWQNGWKHVYYDEDGNLSSESGKPGRSFGYTKEDYPEYGACIAAKHQRIEVQHNQRGSENTVSCPECKIYWKYDSSD